ncbi:ATP-grasp domain-containing protein [Pedococcus sp. 2YAF34]|uniref:ATP-grasp domain-containing protein n=1 Tax=Pedococcus sp. 2YAF34 TaxID=3233032 RepID=UPI003F98691A
MTSHRIALCTWSDPAYVDPEPPLVAEQLTARGHRADVVVWHDDVDWSAYDLVVIRSTWDYFERLEEFLAWVDRVDVESRVVNPPAVVRWNVHKGYLAELGAAGVPVLPMLVVPRGAADIDARIAATGWEQVVVKPAVDGGARKAARGEATSPALVEHARVVVELGDVVVQPYAPGIEDGEVSLFVFGGEVSHAVRKVPADGDYRVQAHHGGAEHPHTATEAELATARAALAVAPDGVTYARVDLVEHEGVPTVMELELIEPDLFLRMDAGALDRYVDLVEAQLRPA